MQLSWLLCFPGRLGKVLFDDFSSLRGERDSDLFLCSGLKRRWKISFFWGLLCLSAPTVVEAAVIAQDGRFIDWAHVCGGLSHRHTAAAALLASRADDHKELSQGAPGSTTGQLAGKSPYSICIPAELCFCNASTFFYLAIIFLHWNSMSSLQNDSTWDSPNILVKQVGAGNFPLKYRRRNWGKTIYSRILSFQVMG